MTVSNALRLKGHFKTPAVTTNVKAGVITWLRDAC